MLKDHFIYNNKSEVFTIMGSNKIDYRHYGSETSEGKFSHTVSIIDNQYSDTHQFTREFFLNLLLIREARKTDKKKEWKKTVYTLSGISLIRTKTVRSGFRMLLIVVWFVLMGMSLLSFLSGISNIVRQTDLPTEFNLGIAGILTLLVILGIDFYYSI